MTIDTEYQFTNTEVLTEGRRTFINLPSDTRTAQMPLRRILSHPPSLTFSIIEKSVSNISVIPSQSVLSYLLIDSSNSAVSFQQIRAATKIFPWVTQVIGNQKLLDLKEKQFSAVGRQLRIAKARAALKRAVVNYEFDDETWRWIAEDSDLEEA